METKKEDQKFISRDLHIDFINLEEQLEFNNYSKSNEQIQEMLKSFNKKIEQVLKSKDEIIEKYEIGFKKIEEMLEQSTDEKGQGFWKLDKYLHGLANGMQMSISLISGKMKKPLALNDGEKYKEQSRIIMPGEIIRQTR